MLVLVVNAGSSTLKCQLIETDGKKSLMKSLAEKIGQSDATMSLQFLPDGQKKRYAIGGVSIDRCLEKVLELMVSEPGSPISSLEDLDAIGNRIVSGGEYFDRSVIIDDETFPLIRKCEALAPLHNPPADTIDRKSVV